MKDILFLQESKTIFGIVEDIIYEVALVISAENNVKK